MSSKLHLQSAACGNRKGAGCRPLSVAHRQIGCVSPNGMPALAALPLLASDCRNDRVTVRTTAATDGHVVAHRVMRVPMPVGC